MIEGEPLKIHNHINKKKKIISPRETGKKNYYERKAPKNLEELYALAEETLLRGKRIIAITDFDNTKSKEFNNGTSPFETGLDPECAKTEIELDKIGVLTPTITNRGAGQIAERYTRLGFNHTPFIEGSYGWEILNPRGESVIDKHWEPYREIITGVLRNTRESLMKEYCLNSPLTHEMTIENRDKAPIYLEIKGLNGKGENGSYTEGLAQTYNLNSVPIDERGKVLKTLNKAADETLEKYSQEKPEETEKLLKDWGMKKKRLLTDLKYPERLTWALEPTLKHGKALGIVTLLWAIEEYNLKEPSIGLVIYSGDHPEQDGEAMWAGKIVERSKNGEGIRFVGILVGRGNETQNGHHDLQIEGVAGCADFLKGLLEKAKEVKTPYQVS